MAFTLSWFALRGTTVVRVVEELRGSYLSARREDIPGRFRLFEQPAPVRAHGWTVVIPEGLEAGGVVHLEAATRWAQVLSYRFVRPAISFLMHEGTWGYTVFDSGREVLIQAQRGRTSPELLGEPARAAALLGVEPKVFEDYTRSQARHQPTPLPGDHFAPADGWAHTDLALRLGIRYPVETTGSVVYAPNEADLALAGADWKGLPRLSR